MPTNAEYRGYSIVADICDSGYCWSIFKGNTHILSDTRAIDGGKLQSERNAINDAKKNIETWHRLENDKKKYKKWIKRNTLKYCSIIYQLSKQHEILIKKIYAN